MEIRKTVTRIIPAQPEHERRVSVSEYTCEVKDDDCEGDCDMCLGMHGRLRDPEAWCSLSCTCLGCLAEDRSL